MGRERHKTWETASPSVSREEHGADTVLFLDQRLFRDQGEFVKSVSCKKKDTKRCSIEIEIGERILLLQ